MVNYVRWMINEYNKLLQLINYPLNAINHVSGRHEPQIFRSLNIHYMY